MSRNKPFCLSHLIDAGSGADRTMGVSDASLTFADFQNATSLGGHLDALEGRRVVLMAGDQLRTAAALVELDGWARRIVICPPDLESRHLAAVFRDAEADCLVFDGEKPPPSSLSVSIVAPCKLPLQPRAASLNKCRTTEWALLTSGTTGDPKMVVHTLATLTHAIPETSSLPEVENWATFYDIRRYGGLQIFLRACAGNGSLTLRGVDEPIESFFTRASVNGVTHISGTPSHWRMALLNAAAHRIDPKYVRLSGETADDSLLQTLSALYPRARVAHAYASTEAGVVFEIADGQAGFPSALLARNDGDVALKLVDESLRVRSGGTALRYLGAGAPALRDPEGFVDTGDLIQQRGERCFFSGRRGGIINIGGAKVNPEEVETAINQHASVHASLVKARRNAITGSLVVADVLLREGVVETETLKDEIVSVCLRDLAPYKVPALIRFVPALAVTGSGKLARS